MPRSLSVLAAILFMLVCLDAQSTVTLAGSVVNAELNPLAGVSITVECAGVRHPAVSDGNGQFSVAGIPAGVCRLRAELAGYPPLSRELRVPSKTPRVLLPLVLTRPGDAAPAASAPPSEASRPIATPPPAPAPLPLNAPVSAPGAAGQAGGGRGASRSIDSIAAVPPAAHAGPVSQQYALIEAWPDFGLPHPGESYAHAQPNRFHRTIDQPLSTFGADVDTASYTNVRRFLSLGQLPPPDAVRVEELVNYFRFDYPGPRDGRPIALTTETADCPWAPSHKLVLIGARAQAPAPREIAGRNIVLLIDVSGSMSPPERLPLIKTALGMFVDTLRADDRIAIVTYAGWSGLALPSTPARDRETIQRAIASLTAGGSTNGGQGLILAYRVAREAFVPGGVNRVILATDGDFNVGIVGHQDLVHLIERERHSGVFLSVLGVGSGNLKDSTMEMLADRGNGHYAYLDSLQEARRVLVREGDATLETVAKDVKFQVEFNPAQVGAWKLLGYENRRLAAADFNDDRKDAGEMGAGHTVTVLYEVVPPGAAIDDGDRADRPAVDPLKYQQSSPAAPKATAPTAAARTSGEWLTVKVRYKAPDDDRSQLISQPVGAGGRAQFLPLASAVAEFGLLLRSHDRSPHAWDALRRRVAALEVPRALASDKDGLAELVAIAAGLSRR